MMPTTLRQSTACPGWVHVLRRVRGGRNYFAIILSEDDAAATIVRLYGATTYCRDVRPFASFYMPTMNDGHDAMREISESLEGVIGLGIGDWLRTDPAAILGAVADAAIIFGA